MLQAVKWEMLISLGFSQSKPPDGIFVLETAVSEHSSAMRTQAPAFDLQLQMDTLP